MSKAAPRWHGAMSNLKIVEGGIMRDLSKIIAAVALLAVVAPAAVAQPQKAAAPKAAGGVTADVRCLLTMVALGQQKERQQAAQLGVYYFTGRIAARAPGLDLRAAMHTEAAQLDGKALEAESRRCGPMISNSIQIVQTGLNSLRPPGPPPAAPVPGPAPLAPAAVPH
jgi:hypothetical protein